MIGLRVCTVDIDDVMVALAPKMGADLLVNGSVAGRTVLDFIRTAAHHDTATMARTTEVESVA